MWWELRDTRPGIPTPASEFTWQTFRPETWHPGPT
jgi:hypothetical protein